MDDTQKASFQEAGEKVIIPLFVELAYMIHQETTWLSYRLFHIVLVSFTLILEIEITPKMKAEIYLCPIWCLELSNANSKVGEKCTNKKARLISSRDNNSTGPVRFPTEDERLNMHKPTGFLPPHSSFPTGNR